MRVTIIVSEGPSNEDFEVRLEDPSYLGDPGLRTLHDLLDGAVTRVKRAYPLPSDD